MATMSETPSQHQHQNLLDHLLHPHLALVILILLSIFLSSTLSHYGPTRKELSLITAGSHCLHYHLNDLNTEKVPAQW